MKKPRFTEEQHDKLGRELQIINRRLNQMHTEVGKAYPLESGCKAVCKKACDAVFAFRSKMDDILASEWVAKGIENVPKLYLRGNADKKTIDYLDSSLRVETDNDPDK